MDSLFQEYESRLVRRRRTPATLRAYRAHVRRFEELVSVYGATPATIEPWQVEELFAESTLAYNTRSAMLSAVRSSYAYGVRRGVINSNPTYDVDLGRRPETEPTVIPNAELREQLAACVRPASVLMFHLFAYTGMRQFEVAKLVWEDIDLPARRMTVVGKGAKLRFVPIHPALGELLIEAQDSESARVVKFVHLAHLRQFAPGRSFHDYRRTAATSLRRNKVDTEVIDRIFGWAPRSIRQRYYDHVADEEMGSAILKLYADDPV